MEERDESALELGAAARVDRGGREGLRGGGRGSGARPWFGCAWWGGGEAGKQESRAFQTIVSQMFVAMKSEMPEPRPETRARVP